MYTTLPLVPTTCMVAGAACVLLILTRTDCPPVTGLGAMPDLTAMTSCWGAAAVVAAAADVLAVAIRAPLAGGNNCDWGTTALPVEALAHSRMATPLPVLS